MAIGVVVCVGSLFGVSVWERPNPKPERAAEDDGEGGREGGRDGEGDGDVDGEREDEEDERRVNRSMRLAHSFFALCRVGFFTTPLWMEKKTLFHFHCSCFLDAEDACLWCEPFAREPKREDDDDGGGKGETT